MLLLYDAKICEAQYCTIKLNLLSNQFVRFWTTAIR